MKQDFLAELGFQKNWVYETLVSTRDGDGQPHASAVGVWSEDLSTLSARLYHGSQTLENLRREGRAAVNLPGGVAEIARVVFGEEHVFETGPQDNPFLPASKGILFISVKDAIQEEGFDELCFFIEDVDIRESPTLINRAAALLLEALIVKSRATVLGRGETKRLLGDYARAIRKTAPGSPYADKADELLQGYEK